MSTQNFKAFRCLLRRAISTRTQAQFANDSGISVEHLNRMLNQDTIYRPSKKTLLKIAAVAKNGITYQMLQDALDKDNPRSVSPEDQAEQTTNAAADFRPEFSDAARAAMEALCAEINKQPLPVMLDNLAEYMDLLVSAVAKTNQNLPKISYDLGTTRPYPGKRYDCATKYVRIDLSMAERFEVATSDMLLYFTEIPSQNGNIKYVIQNASCSVEDIMELFGMPPAAMVAHANEDAGEDCDDPSVLDQALKDPFYIDIQKSELFRKVYRGCPEDTPEQALLNSIFGEESHIPTFIEGVGFQLEDVPPKLLDFILTHRKAVLSPYSNQPKNYDSLSAALDTLAQTHELQPFLDHLDEIEYTDENMESSAGWPAVIATVMSEETGFPFSYQKKSDDPDEKFPWLSNQSVIILSDEAAARNGIQREAILLATCRYVSELGLKRFGDLLFTYIQTLFRKPRSYVVKEKESDGKRESEIILKDEDYSVRLEDAHNPEQTGLYAVKLKDGRRSKIMFLSKQNIWVMQHREWSDLIESYCPAPLKVFTETKE